ILGPRDIPASRIFGGADGGYSMKVGFIGLGAMGAPMAERVVKAGFETFTTFHKRREAADHLQSLGAIVLASPAEVARAADTVITIVPADAELNDTGLGPGVLQQRVSTR